MTTRSTQCDQKPYALSTLSAGSGTPECSPQRPHFRSAHEPLRRRILHNFSASEGGALVEMAMVLPLLLLIVTGVLTFGVALNNYVMLTEAVSTGSRLLAISRGQTTDPCATTANAIYAAAPYLTKANLTFTYVLNGTSYSGASCSSGSTTTGAAGNLVQGASAQVTATYPCSLKVYGYDYAPTCTLSAKTTELVQ